MKRKRVKINEQTAKREHFAGKMWILQGKNAKSGETLVEVMVSIVIFLLLVALLQGSVSFCTNAQRKSTQIREDTEAAIEAYWGGGASTTTGENIPLSFRSKDKAQVFQVNVTLDQTSVPYTDTDGKSQTETFYTFGTN